MLIYTGIGSRQTPQSVLDEMTAYAQRLAVYGYTLRSGGADGADTAFENGARKKEIYLPWKGFNGNDSELYGVDDKAIQYALDYHNYPSALKESHKKLHGRNTYQVLGKDMNTPSEFVIFWAPEHEAQVQGGTSTAVKIARGKGIPDFNLYTDSGKESLTSFMKVKHREFIFRYCRHINLFYTEAIEEDDLIRLDTILIKEKNSKKDLEDINKLFKKYWGVHKDKKHLPTGIENFN